MTIHDLSPHFHSPMKRWLLLAASGVSLMTSSCMSVPATGLIFNTPSSPGKGKFIRWASLSTKRWKFNTNHVNSELEMVIRSIHFIAVPFNFESQIITPKKVKGKHAKITYTTSQTRSNWFITSVSNLCLQDAKGFFSRFNLLSTVREGAGGGVVDNKSGYLKQHKNCTKIA